MYGSCILSHRLYSRYTWVVLPIQYMQDSYIIIHVCMYIVKTAWRSHAWATREKHFYLKEFNKFVTHADGHSANISIEQLNMYESEFSATSSLEESSSEENFFEQYFNNSTRTNKWWWGRWKWNRRWGWNRIFHSCSEISQSRSSEFMVNNFIEKKNISHVILFYTNS